jgi:hypothetical protein
MAVIVIVCSSLYGLLIIAILFAFFGPLRYRDVDAIKAELISIPGVVDVAMWTLEDVDIENIGATVKCDHGGVIVVRGLTRSSLQASAEPAPYVGVMEIGAMCFRIEGVEWNDPRSMKEYNYVSNVVDFGPHGPIATLLPVEIISVGDLIKHYDQIVEAIAPWQKCPPELLEARDSRGLSCRLSVIAKKR